MQTSYQDTDENGPEYEDTEKEEDDDRDNTYRLDTQATTVANSYNDLDIQVMQIIAKNEGSWKCKVCGKTAATKQHIRTHAETHIAGMSHDCHLCSKTFTSRHNLKTHISRVHSQLFSCDICGKTGMNRQGYRDHKYSQHK